MNRNSRGVFAVCLLCIVTGCSKKPGGQAPTNNLVSNTAEGETTMPADPPTGVTGAADVDAPSPYSCQEDSDCTTTCAHGALNKEWFQQNLPVIGDCLDGCQMGADAPRCIDGVCVSFRDGQRDEACTQKPIS